MRWLHIIPILSLMFYKRRRDQWELGGGRRHDRAGAAVGARIYRGAYSKGKLPPVLIESCRLF